MPQETNAPILALNITDDERRTLMSALEFLDSKLGKDYEAAKTSVKREQVSSGLRKCSAIYNRLSNLRSNSNPF